MKKLIIFENAKAKNILCNDKFLFNKEEQKF